MSAPLFAEFASPARLLVAARHVRAMGYVALEAYTPFPIPALDDVLAIRRTRLPYAVFAAAVFGIAAAYALLRWTNGVDYALNVGGRPYNSIPTHIPIVFEVMVLFAACTAFVLALVLSGLPRLHHDVFELDGFERTSVDRFWLRIGNAGAPRDRVDSELLAELLTELHGLGAVRVWRGQP